MSPQLDERIKIAASFNSIYSWQINTPKRKARALRNAHIVSYGLIQVVFLFLIVTSAMTSFGNTDFTSRWANAGMLVTMAIGFSLQTPFIFIESQLQKHVKKLQGLDFNFDERLNVKLKEMVKKFSTRARFFRILGIPAIIILTAALLQVLELNAYWDKFPPLVFIVSLGLFAQINYNIIVLKRNLSQVVKASLKN